MKKKQIANLIMVAVIAVIIAAGVLGVGLVQGWFDADNGESVVLTDIRGIVNLERNGISFTVSEDTVLRTGDKITCTPGATAAIYTNEELLMRVDSASRITILDPTAEHFQFDTEVLTKSTEPAETEETKPEETLSSQTESTQQTQPQETASTDTPAPSEDKPVQTAPQQTQPAETEPAQTVPAATEAPVTEPPVTQAPTPQPTEPKPTEPKPTEATTSATKPAETEPPETKPADTKPAETKPAETEPSETQDTSLTCTISIRCDTILDNMANLNPAKVPYVPSDGWILWAEVTITEGETVFDVLKRACEDYGIQLEYSWSPMYDSYYVEGINHLYEFDCGYESGWMYQVDGWFPNYGCSSYTLTGGEDIVWSYTCTGLGTDVGGGV